MNRGKMLVAPSMAGRLMSPEIVMKMVAGEQVHLCLSHRGRRLAEKITQSHTILNSNSHLLHWLSRTHKISGFLKRTNGQKTIIGMIRKMGMDGVTTGGITIIIGTNNLTLRHGPMLYLHLPFVPKYRRTRQLLDGKAGARRRADYQR